MMFQYWNNYTSPNLDWIGSFADLVEAFLGDSSGQDCSTGGAISRLLVGVVGHILDKSGPNVLVLIL